MTRIYLVNAVVASDAWTRLEAESQQAAAELAAQLRATDFELGDAFDVLVHSVEDDS